MTLSINGDVVHGIAIAGNAFIDATDAGMPNLIGKSFNLSDSNGSSIHCYHLINNDPNFGMAWDKQTASEEFDLSGSPSFLIVSESYYNGSLYVGANGLNIDDSSEYTFENNAGQKMGYMAVDYFKYSDIKAFIENGGVISLLICFIARLIAPFKEAIRWA